MAQPMAAAAARRSAMRNMTVMSSSTRLRRPDFQIAGKAQSLPEPSCSGRGRFRLLHHARVFSNRRARQPEVITQRRARIGSAVEAPPLQFRNDEVDKFVERARKI